MKTKLFIQRNFSVVGVFPFLFSLCILLPAVSSAQPIAAGSFYSLSVCADSTARGWGDNTSGELGIGTADYDAHPTPVQVNSLTGITAVAGWFHTLFLKNDGTVWSCGYNQLGELGLGTADVNPHPTPKKVHTITGIVAVAVGNWHSLFVKNDGTVWACGNNGYGELGDGTITERHTPVHVSSLTGIIAVAGGYEHSLFLKNDGTVWACGWNANGQLGDGTNTDRHTPVQVSPLTGIVAVACGQDHSLFVKNDGTVWACGSNENGQLGDGTTTARYTPVEVTSLSGIIAAEGGDGYSLFLKIDGTVWACGWNAYGQLGVGDITDRHTPVQVTSLTGITAVSCGDGHSLFLKNNGTVWACGSNSFYGALGDGTTIERHTPVHVIDLCTVLTAVTEPEDDPDFSSVQIYPNPTTGQLSVSDYNLSGKSTIEIYDVFGKKVYSEIILNQKSLTLNLDVPGGIYFVQIQTPNFIETKKLIISK